MRKFYTQKISLLVGLITIITAQVAAQTFTIEQSVTGNNRTDIRGQVFVPSQQDEGSGSITSTGPVYLTAFDVIYAGGTEAPTLYIYSTLPSDLTSLDDGTGGVLVGESTAKAEGEFPYTTYSFDYLELDKNTTYYAVFRQDVQLEFGGSGSADGPYTGGKMLVNTGAAVEENDFTALKFIGTFDNTLTPHQGDLDALIALYNATDGPNWNIPWDLDANPYGWNGVTWEGNRVKYLALNNNSLSGEIPAELGNLVNLTILKLHSNSLSGSIPAELGNLASLTDLWLHNNSLTGSIPAELGNLASLTDLRLHLNSLSGSIPAELGNLINLVELSLGNNSLSGPIPAELGNLVNLEELYIYDNFISGAIPAELGNLINLVELSLLNNSLSGPIPAELGNLVNLEELYIRDNSISGSIPAELGNLVNLTRLDLHNNSLTGSIPAELGNLASLTDLWLHHNSLSGSIPVELGNLTKLIILSIQGNKFDFGDLEPVASFLDGVRSLNIYPQEKLSVPDSIYIVDSGTVLTLTIQTEGLNNQYQWYKNGESVSEISTIPDYTIEDFQITDAGMYYCEVTNTSVPSLTLHSKNIEISYHIGFNNGYPLVRDATTSDIVTNVSINKGGNVFAVALPAGSPEPTVQQVLAGQNSSGESIEQSENIVLDANEGADLVISGLDPKTLYDLYFIAEDTVLNMTTEVVKLEAATITSLSDEFSQHELKIFPNPVSNILTVDLRLTELYNLSLLDMKGQVHYMKGALNGSTKIDLSNFNDGVYLLKITTPEKSDWIKVIKR